MLYSLLAPLASDYGFLNVIRYITFRCLAAALLALLISFLFGPRLIRVLRAGHIGQPVSKYMPEGHAAKEGTPTMGGVLVISSLLLAVLLLADLANVYILITLSVIAAFGALGGLDDYLKVSRGSNAGLSTSTKFAGQVLIATVAMTVLYLRPEFDSRLSVPFFKHFHPDLGWGYVPFAVLVIVGTSNAVNLTDGLDGLAIGPIMTTAATYTVFTYCAGHAKIAAYLLITPVPGAGELAVVCSAIAAASLGFLWFNSYPASIFLGDVGSLALGAALGTVAVVSKNEIVLVLAGGVFVVEAVSVIVQVASMKLRGKRVFRMAPIHHHFEMAGWPEPLIIVRFWIISVICALAALATLRLR